MPNVEGMTVLYWNSVISTSSIIFITIFTDAHRRTPRHNISADGCWAVSQFGIIDPIPTSLHTIHDFMRGSLIGLKFPHTWWNFTTPGWDQWANIQYVFFETGFTPATVNVSKVPNSWNFVKCDFLSCLSFGEIIDILCHLTYSWSDPVV